jgi:hypothetical protein
MENGFINMKYKQPLQYQKNIEKKEEKTDFLIRIKRFMDMQRYIMEMNIIQLLIKIIERI